MMKNTSLAAIGQYKTTYCCHFRFTILLAFEMQLFQSFAKMLMVECTDSGQRFILMDSVAI